MRKPAEVWEGCANDDRWIEQQADVVDEIMREAFAAGFQRGATMAAAAIEGHAASVAVNSVLRLPESVPRGLRAACERALELGIDQAVVQGAWREAIALFRPNAVTLQQVQP